MVADVRRGEQAAVGLHQRESRDAERGGPFGETAHVTAHHRLDESVDGRRARPFVLAELGYDVARDRDRGVGVHLLDQREHALLVARVPVAVEEADRDGGDAGGGQACDCLHGPVLVELPHDLAERVQPLRDLGATILRRQRAGLRVVKVVDRVPILPLQLEQVLEAGRGQEAELRTLALQHRVGGDRRSVDQLHAVEALVRDHRQRFEDAFGRVGRGREGLGGGEDVPVRTDQDQVGESTADLDAELHDRAGPLTACR